jgi:glyoxylase I family protein
MPDIVGVHHLSLSVSDLGRSTEWYRQVLGFDLVAQVEGNGFSRTRLRAAGRGLTLSLTAHHEPAADSFDERRPGMDHVAFQVAAGGIDALKHRFEALGVVHSEVKTSAGGAAMITLRDPDGIQLEVFGEQIRT